MAVASILSPAGLSLRQNVIYRARLLIKAPGVVATEGKVEAALREQGFADIQFFDRDKLPGDWPAEERDDPSGAFSWTAFLQGKFTLTDRTITYGELPGTVKVLDMWDYLVPLTKQPPLPGVDSLPPTTFPTVGPPPPDLSAGQKVFAVVIGASFALFALSVLNGNQRSVWR